MEMVLASKIAYMDFDQSAVLAGGYSIKELLAMELQSSGCSRKDEIKWILDMMDQYHIGTEWKLKNIRNDQHGSGMYACMIDTGDGNALIAFRGSESDTLENMVKDWGLSDFGLLNNILTPQQNAAETYMRDLYQQYGDAYDGFGVTGHSLGGNLAEHSVITAPDHMRKKIIRCDNLDGPGFSEEYLLAHNGDINKSRGKIRHYQWSLIGSLLHPVWGSDFQTIKADTPKKNNELESLLWRHDLVNLKFDDRGNFCPGEQDILADRGGPLADVIDLTVFQIFAIPSIAVAVTYNTLDQIRDLAENIWEKWNEIRYAQKNAQYEISVSKFDAGLDQLNGLGRKLQEISGEIEQIQRQLAFQSVGSGYVKLKLWGLAGGVERDGKKVQSLCENGFSCKECYTNTERQIAGNYL